MAREQKWVTQTVAFDPQQHAAIYALMDKRGVTSFSAAVRVLVSLGIAQDAIENKHRDLNEQVQADGEISLQVRAAAGTEEILAVQRAVIKEGRS